MFFAYVSVSTHFFKLKINRLSLRTAAKLFLQNWENISMGKSSLGKK
jgi:hypothetical protein